jgi:hypothetical protein
MKDMEALGTVVTLFQDMNGCASNSLITNHFDYHFE